MQRGRLVEHPRHSTQHQITLSREDWHGRRIFGHQVSVNLHACVSWSENCLRCNLRFFRARAQTCSGGTHAEFTRERSERACSTAAACCTMPVHPSAHPLILHKITQMRKVRTWRAAHGLSTRSHRQHSLALCTPLCRSAGDDFQKVPIAIDEGGVNLLVLRGDG